MRGVIAGQALFYLSLYEQVQAGKLLLGPGADHVGPEPVSENTQLPGTAYGACGCTNTLVLPLRPVHPENGLANPA
jgi:hypothetical protein